MCGSKRPAADDAERGVAPVVGVGLLIAIVVTLAAVTLFMLGGLTDQTDPAPQAALDLQIGDGGPSYELVHQGGDKLSEQEGRIVVRGIADPDVLDGGNLSADSSVTVYPVEDTVEVVWYGEDSDESYVLDTFEADPIPAAPDEGCEWVESETSNSTSTLTLDGITVACNIETSLGVKVKNGSTVIGDVNGSGVDVDNSDVVGAIEAPADDVDLKNASVAGGVDAVGDVSTDDNTTVEGSIATTGDVDIDGTTVDDHVYVGNSYTCDSSTVNGDDCADYTPRDYDDY